VALSRRKYEARAVKGMLSSPGETTDKAVEEYAGRWERVVWPLGSQRRADDDWKRRLYHLIGAPWPCPAHVAFAESWNGALETMAGVYGRSIPGSVHHLG
jgi:hypothetical protein